MVCEDELIENVDDLRRMAAMGEEELVRMGFKKVIAMAITAAAGVSEKS